jgi:NAD(P)-dependent dehydrogenase (short-subunit alcohol dehydrogenase family)
MTATDIPWPAERERLDGRVAVVLGAGSVGPGMGIGRAISVLFASHGARLCCVDRDEAALADTVNMVREAGGEAIALTGDVTDEAALAQIVSRAADELGDADILVNNVGSSMPGGPTELTLAQWHQQFALNLRYAFSAIQLMAPGMTRCGAGAIVNVSSIAALRYLGRSTAAYASSKAALLQLSRQVAVELAPQGIRSNCVIPGLIETPSVLARLDPRRWHERPPMQRIGNAWDIAYAALYLASDEARYVTGAELLVDGGLTATMR